MSTQITDNLSRKHDYWTDIFRNLQAVCPLKDIDAGKYSVEDIGRIYNEKVDILQDVYSTCYYGLLEFANTFEFTNIDFVVAPSWRLCYYFEGAFLESYYSLDVDILVFDKNTKRKSKTLASVKIAVDERGYFYRVNPINKAAKITEKLCQLLASDFPEYIEFDFLADLPETTEYA